jgi:hypothetical protein
MANPAERAGFACVTTTFLLPPRSVWLLNGREPCHDLASTAGEVKSLGEGHGSRRWRCIRGPKLARVPNRAGLDHRSRPLKRWWADGRRAPGQGGQEPIRPGEPLTYWAVGITFPAPN